MDNTYVTKEIMLTIEKYGKALDSSPQQYDRQVDANGITIFQKCGRLEWTKVEKLHDILITLKDFPENHKVIHLRYELSAHLRKPL